ncbi:MAG: ATP synthase subunit delta [Candidatus Pacebacteria bacterium GW2011_GWF2_38_9]|nr:MAG: ATP synthase F1 subcomplex subunit delta, F-type H+-transporting ATPase subunit delta [candidate division TM6 bacterium GW2011_GWF2_28_16]KKQ88507.1 MAG: ATP synthase subunit delta [Candidatus Pacebacteria bacterium GW2011_GWF2_38_9]MBU1033481.1 F0F1 ATP synthase subunit delta [Patescibacteria group bacterium]HAZ73358.1 hypothetical protein [Candidatus Paceibacterota bacterium]
MLKITVASATPLNSTQKKELELSVAKKYEGEELVFNYQVKADLIAGLSVSVGRVEDKRLKVDILSAIALNATQQKKIEQAIAKKYEGEELVFNYQVKADLIAGLSVSVDSKLYDASLRARLDQLIKQM